MIIFTHDTKTYHINKQLIAHIEYGEITARIDHGPLIPNGQYYIHIVYSGGAEKQFIFKSEEEMENIVQLIDNPYNKWEDIYAY